MGVSFVNNFLINTKPPTR